MAGYLLDTNHLGLAVTPASSVRRRLEEVRKTGERFGTCVPALCEIEAGVLQVRHPEEYRLNLKRLLRHVRIWPLDLETARYYGEIYLELRQKARVLSQVDMMLAALRRRRSKGFCSRYRAAGHHCPRYSPSSCRVVNDAWRPGLDRPRIKL